MATVRFLASRASARAFHHLLPLPRPQDSPTPSRFLRTLHSFVSREFHSRGRSQNPPPPNSRGMVSVPDRGLDDPATPGLALSPDDRVPATVLTGFLGSGKVGFSYLKLCACTLGFFSFPLFFFFPFVWLGGK